MALTIEDGTVVANADSYITEAEADTILANYDKEAKWTLKTTDEKEALLRSAAGYLDTKYNWKGTLTTLAQNMSWPRCEVYVDNMLVDEASIPTAIKRAQAFLAAEAIDTPLFSTKQGTDGSGALTANKVKVGPIEIEKAFDESGSSSSMQPRFAEVDALVRILTTGGSRRLPRG